MKNIIWSNRENEVLKKRLSGARLSQQESNYLSRFIRPKLRKIMNINAESLLSKLEYNQMIKSIEGKIKKILLSEITDIDSITLYGSVILNNYKNYNDIDILVVVKKKSWEKIGEKYKKIFKIKKLADKEGLNLDINIYDKNDFNNSYQTNISLIYQLKDSKTIHGNLKLKTKLEVSKLDLRMKVDYSIINSEESLEIYKALRNLILVDLLLEKIVDNEILNQRLIWEVGGGIIEKLKSDNVTNNERKIALLHLKRLLNLVLKKIEKLKCQKIVLSNH